VLLQALDSSKVDTFQSEITRWFTNKGRRFPWRRTRDPFKVLIAEVLLRLTGPLKIEKAYNDIISRFGTPQFMANADLPALLEIFRPLGLHVRAGLLKQIAGELNERFGGEVPSSYAELVSLKGIGQYTANAILCLAFDKRVPLVDGNVSRIFHRCFNFSSSKAAYIDRELWGLAQEILPEGSYREFNLGLIDLGALVCKYSHPLCSSCPIVSICIYYGASVI